MQTGSNSQGQELMESGVGEERPSLQELELRVKEQELKLKVLEVRAKERDVAASRWLNPVVIGLFAAALGLVGNIIVTTINNTNTQRVERSRTQSTVILEAIKTNGGPNAVCNNLIFFVSLGLIEDTNHAITKACPGDVQGIPSVGPPDLIGGHEWYPLTVETVDNKGAPIAGVSVEANLISPEKDFQIPPSFLGDMSSDKYLGVHRTSIRCTSGKNGYCYPGMVPSSEFIAILATKEGYVGNRANRFFTGASVVVVLKKNSANR